MTSEVEYFSPDTFWFAIWTRSRQEKVVASIFESLGIENFLPLKTEVHRWSDRKQSVTIPLFKGYLFARLNPTKDSRLRVLNTPGVAGLVGNQAGPLPVPDYEIESIRAVIAQKMQYTAYPSIPIGTLVRVVRGPLTGTNGTLVRTYGESKLVLSVEMIHQSIALSIGSADVEPIGVRTHVRTVTATPAIALA